MPNVIWHVPLGAPCHNRVGDIETSKKWKMFGVQSRLPSICWSGDHVQVAMLIVSVRTRRPRGLRLRVVLLTAGRLCVKRSVGRVFPASGAGSEARRAIFIFLRWAPALRLSIVRNSLRWPVSGAVYILVFRSYSPRKGGSRILKSPLRRVTHLGVDQCLPRHTQPFLDNHPGFALVILSENIESSF